MLRNESKCHMFQFSLNNKNKMCVKKNSNRCKRLNKKTETILKNIYAKHLKIYTSNLHRSCNAYAGQINK